MHNATLEQLDRDWERAMLRNVRIHVATLCLIEDCVELLQKHSSRKLEEVKE